jgi:hypothetical protein
MGHRDEVDIVTLHWCVTNEVDLSGPGGGAGRAVSGAVRFCFDLGGGGPP